MSEGSMPEGVFPSQALGEEGELTWLQSFIPGTLVPPAVSHLMSSPASPTSFRHPFFSNPAADLDQSAQAVVGGLLVMGGLVKEFTWLRKVVKPGFQAQLALFLAVGPGGDHSPL